ncbi:MAG: dTDP-glucose 4,6-dehydratase [Desulfomicrobiaceae bacterium]
MHLLVTGGCGFIGTNFILHLLETDPAVRITNLDKLTYAGNRGNLAHLEGDGSRYAFVHGDIADAALVERLLAEHAIDAVVHFAAESHVDRSITDSAPFIHTNVAGTHTLLEAARKAGVQRFVHVSTDEVYGSLGPHDPAFTEETPLAPNSPYSASKAASDMLARAYFHTYGLPVIITRCSNNYGPYQFPEKLIPLTYLRATRGEPVPVYGDGSNVRDWIYVLDHCRGVEAALRRGEPGKVYNFGGDAERTNLETVHTILDAVGAPRSLVRFVTDRPGHDRRYAMNSSRAKQELGWRPETDFATGIAQTIRWYQTHAAWLDDVQSGAYRQFMEKWYAKERGV